MKKADLLALGKFQPGDKVRLTDGVLHKEYAGKRGIVLKTIKSRREVVVQVFDMDKPYYAYPENVEHVEEGRKHEA